MISIVIPAYNESAIIGRTLSCLIETISPEDEIIVVDGGSEDATVEIAGWFAGVKVMKSYRGRAAQMNVGAEAARGEYVLFLHADVSMDENCLSALRKEIREDAVPWGWFSITLDSPGFIFRALESGANLRNRVTGTPLGDHGIFARKEIFNKVGGFPEIPIMEDLEFVKRMKSVSEGREIKQPVTISVRRFEGSGIVKTFLTMWILRVLYYSGIPPQKLGQYYPNVR